MSKKICLISSGQPSANPRLVKELITFFDADYQLTVIYCSLSPWADTYDEHLFARYPQINWIRAGSHPQKNWLNYRYARIRRKVYDYVFKYFGDIFNASERSLILFSQELNSAACKIKADLYIGHNLGALPSLVRAAQINNAKSIFDFEDYHRGESENGSLIQFKVRSIEDKYIPFVDSLTAASPGITEAYKSFFQNKSIVAIKNVYPISYSVKSFIDLPHYPLKLFWFSQHIGRNRGIESVIYSMSKLKQGSVTLTLLGNCTKETLLYFNNIISILNVSDKYIQFLKPVSESIITTIASQYHIGLAIEPGRDQNNELALSNKIMMYLHAGNALVASDTKSQKIFLETYPDIGLLFKKDDPESLVKTLQFYMDFPEILNQHRRNAIKLGKEEMNWEVEKHICLDNVKKTLNS